MVAILPLTLVSGIIEPLHKIGDGQALNHFSQPMIFRKVTLPLSARPPLLFAFGSDAVYGLRVDPAAISYLKAGQNFLDFWAEVTVKVRYAAPWMRHAFGELGEKEIPGTKANPRILSYFKSSRFWGTDDSGGQNAWCASFVSWVMEQSNYESPKAAFRARSWSSFGRKLGQPVFGAIAVKSRRGGGHVAFVVGQSEDGKYLFMLGGNQQDEVNITRYPRNVWTSFLLPSDYDSSADALPVYRGGAKIAGSET
ncbi:MAG: TIGR02594 family protein [Pseudomonadales bacterium]|nr:TIGR02594 family protein [Pseudomonadales bacterium]